MADNITAPATGGIFATDDVGGVQYPRTKISIGADGAAADVHSGNPLPINIVTPATVPVSIAGTVNVSQATTLPTGTDRSGTITTGGTAQTLAALNASRKGLYLQNISGADLWINEGGTALANTAGSWKIAPGETFSATTNKALSIVGATTAQAFTAIEF